MAAERGEDAAHLVVGAAGDGDRREGGGLGRDVEARVGVGALERSRSAAMLRAKPVVEHEVRGQRTGRARERRLIRARHGAFRVGEALDLRAVGRPEQEARGVDVQAADRAQLD